MAAPYARETLSIDDYGNLLGKPPPPTTTNHCCGATSHRAGTSRLGFTHYVNSGTDLTDHISWYRNEMDKKERIVEDLAKADVTIARKETAMQHCFYDGLINQYRTSMEDAKADLAAAEIKLKSLEYDLKTAGVQLSERESLVIDLKSEIETLRENNGRQAALVLSLRKSLSDIEGKAGCAEICFHKSNATIEALEKRVALKDQKIADLELHLSEYFKKSEEFEANNLKASSNYRSLISALFTLLGGEATEEVHSDHEEILGKVRSLQEEKRILSEKMERMTEVLAQSEMETKASRETIMRLVSEANRLQADCTTNQSNYTSITMKNEELTRTVSSLESEISSLKEQLAESKESLSHYRSEAEELHRKYLTLETTIKNNHSETQHVSLSHDKFVESLAAILSHDFKFVEKSSECILHTIRELLYTYSQVKTKLEQQHERWESSYKLLAEKDETIKSLLRKSNISESQLKDYNSRLIELEGNIASKEVSKDDSMVERQRYLEFLESLGRVLKLDTIVGEVGLDMSTQAILARCEQLTKGEAETIVEKGSTIYSLQRKCKKFKEELEGKDVHLEMLRKKIIQLEEKASGKVALVAEKDEVDNKAKKYQKMAERLRLQLGDAKISISELKAELSDLKDFKLKGMEKEDQIKELVNKIETLQKIKNKQARQLAGMKQEMEYTEYEARNDTQQQSNTVLSLSEELRSTKRALDEVARREKQLVDFRAVISRMLGLDMGALAVPDYEIISRMERLIHRHREESARANTGEDRLDKFWGGYEDAKNRYQRKKTSAQTNW